MNLLESKRRAIAFYETHTPVDGALPNFPGRVVCKCGASIEAISLEALQYIWALHQIEEALAAVPESATPDDPFSKASSACDICDVDTPHHHDEQLVEIERLVRPAFEETTVPRGAFGRIARSLDFPYSDAETERLWNHFIGGWFKAKEVYAAPTESKSATPVEPVMEHYNLPKDELLLMNLVSHLRRGIHKHKDEKWAKQASEYLERKGIVGNILRSSGDDILAPPAESAKGETK